MKRRNFIWMSTGLATATFTGALSALAKKRIDKFKAIDKCSVMSNKASLDVLKELNPNTKWLKDAKWGAFSHYLAHMPSKGVPPDMNGEKWNERVKAFDVDLLAKQLSSVGVSYYFITIGQGGGYFCSPNEKYEKLFGPSSGKLAKRDLIAELAQALAAKNIRLGVYLPGVGRNRPSEYESWWAVIREWSERWGRSVSAWWIDGVYEKPETYKSFTMAFKSGNPDAIVTYNTGPVSNIREQVNPATEYEDYLAGEVDWFLPTSGFRVVEGKEYYSGPNINGDQFHYLNFLGEWWGTGKPRFPVDLVTGWTKHINDHGGTVTWDIPLSITGAISKDYLQQMAALKRTAMRR